MVLAYVAPERLPEWSHLLFGGIMLVVFLGASWELFRLSKEQRVPKVVSKLRAEIGGSALFLVFALVAYSGTAP